jgi:DNA-binding NtrC family response regulator
MPLRSGATVRSSRSTVPRSLSRPSFSTCVRIFGSRVGGHEVIEVGEFREDLSDRLNVVEIRAK